MKKIQFIFLSLIMLSMTTILNVNAQSSTSDKESARVFVQKFYDWYNKLANSNQSGKNSIDILSYATKHKSQSFDKGFLTTYNEYYNAEPKEADEIVGLDFDPILAAQDIGFDYQTGIVKKIGDKYFVDIHYDMIGKTRNAVLKSHIAVIAVVINVNNEWKFTNFIYPPPDGNGGNLLDMLRGYKKEAEKYTATHKNKTH